MSAPVTARARARAELSQEIKAVARRQLAEGGAASLSLRAVARELGMVSSAIYRYFPSRDALLTALIIDAYNALGEAAEAADATRRRRDLVGRWLAIASGVRGWALAHPHEYALIYGSPVPGYQAPEDTIGPATRVAFAMGALLREAAAAGVLSPEPAPRPVPAALRADARRLGGAALAGVPEQVVMQALTVWAQLFGMVSFELFGQFNNVVEARDVFFEQAMRAAARHVGLKA